MIKFLKIVGAILLVVVVVISLMLWRRNSNNREKRNELCGYFSEGKAFSAADFFQKSAGLGVETVKLKSNGKIIKQTRHALFDGTVADLEQIDRVGAAGQVTAYVGFPTHYTCRVDFSEGKASKVSTAAFD